MSSISYILITWYHSNKRSLPWRETLDPYIIWISEIILQQTRVNQGLPYFYKFLEKFPNVKSLAEAEESDVLMCWEGLGYYSRARNMHATAKLIFDNFNGIFPNSFIELIKLKGIGSYTASAIASFSFAEHVAVLDGNVIRVISRLFNFEEDTNLGISKKRLQQIATSILPEKLSEIHNQAIMEFGALHCVPINPDCESCVLKGHCQAFKMGNQNNLPFKSKKQKPRIRYFNYIIFKTDVSLFFKKRLSGDIWQGLNDFYLVESERGLINNPSELFSSLDVAFKDGILELPAFNEFKHVLTHQIIFAKFWVLKVDYMSEQFMNDHFLIEISKNNWREIPKPVLIKNFLDQYYSHDKDNNQ